MADPTKSTLPSIPVWHELGPELGLSYEVDDDGEIKARDVAVIDDRILTVNHGRYNTIGLALNRHCDIMVVDGQHRMLTRMAFEFSGSVGRTLGHWSNAHECAYDLAQKAADYEFPILGQIVSADDDGYHVDLGGELRGYLPMKPKTPAPLPTKRARKRFFRVKQVDPQASDVLLDYWAGGAKRRKAVSVTTDDSIILTLIALGDSMGSPVTVLSAALRLWGERIEPDASSAEVETVAQSGARYFGTFSSEDIAVAAVTTAREAQSDARHALGALKIAEWTLTHKHDVRRLAFVQVELARQLQRRGEMFEARLYAQTAAKGALKTRAAGVARAAVEVLSGVEFPMQRA